MTDADRVRAFAYFADAVRNLATRRNCPDDLRKEIHTLADKLQAAAHKKGTA